MRAGEGSIYRKNLMTYIDSPESAKKVKPLLRGWFHAAAALVAVVVTVILCWLSRNDIPRFFSLLIFGLSMIELYTLSAIYHIPVWSPAKRQVWRAH
jgi:hemolysin III